MALSVEELRKIACDAIDKEEEALRLLSEDIYNHPELAYKETYAHELLSTFLEKRDFTVERHYLLDTAFRSVVECGDGPNIAVCCEYDALPEFGHACGHNLIAEAGIAASIGLKAALNAARSAGMKLGKLSVLGTPAEEGGGGKIKMLNMGGFKDITAAMMVHPSPLNIQTFPTFARERFQVKFHGKASHAASGPWDGVNALDAAFTAYGNISCLRQQMKPTWRIHGIVTNGGKAPNVIPEETEMDYYIRTESLPELKTLKEKAVACFQGAAKATGCSVEIISSNEPYADVVTNWTMANVFTEHAEAMGIVFNKTQAVLGTPQASTDMGNVSYVVPSIHPMYEIGTRHHNHTREFLTASGSPEGQVATIVQAKVMAKTALDMFCNPDLVKKAQEEYKNSPNIIAMNAA